MGSNLPAGAGSLGFIRRCRDLVELYYGARMVASVIENFFLTNGSSQIRIMTVDPRRIRYEIVAQDTSLAANSVELGSNTGVNNGAAPVYTVAASASVPIVDRNFLTELDLVTDELWAQSFGNMTIYVRETFLTPPPVDETS